MHIFFSTCREKKRKTQERILKFISDSKTSDYTAVLSKINQPDRANQSDQQSFQKSRIYENL